ncbi:hypothetical protein [Jeotgalibacillus soli]|uniref:Uncharacterized protein n=1 Tax=Jeotgalibacillus soli TaxID=889306 RepID=A0A0C2RVE7_9BACL|nr:hypothetical protein [Jeotgalibacillus soli]KIL45734.1 hypothetical protein KP78_20830 [Jeotgalibacillus soli]
MVDVVQLQSDVLHLVQSDVKRAEEFFRKNQNKRMDVEVRSGDDICSFITYKDQVQSVFSSYIDKETGMALVVGFTSSKFEAGDAEFNFYADAQNTTLVCERKDKQISITFERLLGR